ncbi:MAG: hypothetical protein Kow00114_13960 [Kiloniellaceae bacterium]
MSGDDSLGGSQGRRLTRLLDRRGEADYELDLTGLDFAHAAASVDRMVERQRFRDTGRSVVVRIDPATPDSGETLFGRLGRHLLDLKRRGLVATLAPLDPRHGAGFNLTLPAGKEAKSESLEGLLPDDDETPV